MRLLAKGFDYVKHLFRNRDHSDDLKRSNNKVYRGRGKGKFYPLKFIGRQRRYKFRHGGLK